jgi:hypothetical protein
MRPTWLIEAGVYRAEEIDPLLAEIRRQGMAAELVPHRALTRGDLPVIDERPLADGDSVLAYGTFPFVRQVQLHHRWVPGAWATQENLDCTTYFAHFGPFLLNQPYAILPGVEAIRQRNWLFSTFGKDDEVFARPSGCHKLFVGRLIARESFPAALAPARYDPATLVVIAAPRTIAREWRLVVTEGEVIAASQYAEEGERSVEPGCPDRVRAFAETMLAEVRWRPDPVFMMDVCEAEGQLRLVELNSFSSSWLYRCDLPAVVARAGEIATREWSRTATLRGEA